VNRIRLTLIAVATLVAASFPPAASASPTAVFGPCPVTAGPGARCGTVPVPLDRTDPAAGTIPIAFDLYVHTDSTRSAVSTIVTSDGGPGLSNTLFGEFWRERLRPALVDHDLLAIDHRGTGRSAAIDCPALQHVQGDQRAAARRCASQLGDSVTHYGSADSAADVDAVRVALHIDKIDYYGVSYGATDVRAYAYRYPEHLRSAVLDSPDFTTDDTFFTGLPPAMDRISALVCERSPSCAAGIRDPQAVLARLVTRIRAMPVRGTGYDSDGNPHAVVVDENALLGVLYNEYFTDPAFLGQGEIFAAAEALDRGDPTPLLRLAAESPPATDFGPSDGQQSVGADYATFCADTTFPWADDASPTVQESQYQAALRALPKNASSPFSAATWAGFLATQPVTLVPGGDACVGWPRPNPPTPPFPAGQRFPHGVPAIILGGGLDYLDVAEERQLTKVIPDSTFVTVASAGHVTTGWSPCAQRIAATFLETLRPGGLSCAANPLGDTANPFGTATGRLQVQGLGAFPLTTAEASAADRLGGDGSTATDGKIAAVAWATVEDAVYRSLRMTGGQGRGLRGGTYTVSANGIDLHADKFSVDTAVSGHVTFDKATDAVTADVTISGPGGSTGKLTMTARLWRADAPDAVVCGVIDGQQVAVVTPAR
jgi:pimeloyl-ACP methyl ester carboxylesterase